jgi:hypothetical protein
MKARAGDFIHQFASSISPHMARDLVYMAPEERMLRHRYDDSTPVLDACPHFSKDLLVLPNVLEYIECADNIELFTKWYVARIHLIQGCAWDAMRGELQPRARHLAAGKQDARESITDSGQYKTCAASYFQYCGGMRKVMIDGPDYQPVPCTKPEIPGFDARELREVGRIMKIFAHREIRRERKEAIHPGRRETAPRARPPIQERCLAGKAAFHQSSNRPVLDETRRIFSN